jgi:hypothetical protein
MKLTTKQAHTLLEKYGSYVTQTCDVRQRHRPDQVHAQRRVRGMVQQGMPRRQRGSSGRRMSRCGAMLEGKRRGAKWCCENCRHGVRMRRWSGKNALRTISIRSSRTVVSLSVNFANPPASPSLRFSPSLSAPRQPFQCHQQRPAQPLPR